MHRLWDPLISTILDLADPRVVVEVGSDEGANTKELLAWCRDHDAVLHAIDPRPRFDAAAWVRDYPDHFVFHKALSLEALPLIEDADLVLIDGDHNWYTVINELRAIRDRAADSFPLVVLDDVAWPYGRRDLYYDPERIPEPDRHPFARGGVRPGRHDLDADGGINPHLIHATHEGGPRNGVLTAVEDFLAETQVPVDLTVVPVVHGIGILLPEGRRSNAPLSAYIDALASSPEAIALVERAESLRIDAMLAAARDRALRKEAEEVAKRRRGEIEERDRTIGALRAQIASVAQERDQVAAVAKRLRWEVKAANQRFEEQAAGARRLAEDRDRMRRDRDLAVRKYTSLRNRRSIRVVIRVASLAKPLFAAWRRLKRMGRRRGPAGADQADSVPQPAITPVTEARGNAADIVVCVHNAEDDVQRCLDSVAATTNLSVNRLIIVDDGSDEPVRRLLEAFASTHPATLIRNHTARGYPAAANQGMAASTAGFVVLLNSDTIVSPGWLERLVRCAAQPGTGVVGPYSNAATWQSVPKVHGPDGGWAVNPLPDGAEPSDIAASVARWSPHLEPEVPLVNGFCYVITREALDRVGGFDEATFPRGYGEEDDFSLRCAAAGLTLRIADDCYVYHAKSKSFTPQGRSEIAAASQQALRDKNGPEVVDAAVRRIRFAEDLVRSRTVVSLGIERDTATVDSPDLSSGLSVGWVMPHLEEAGGVRRAIEMTNRLVRWGGQAAVITPEGERTTWLPILADVLTVDAARERAFDVLIVSDPDMIAPFASIDAGARVIFHLAAYMLYRAEDEALPAFYGYRADGLVHVANSRWTGEQVTGYAGTSIEATFPGGVDARLFRPMRVERSHDVVCSGSPRVHKGTQVVRDACAPDLSLLEMEAIAATQRDLPRVINSGRVFASAAFHEGFNMTVLEAMACGIPVVMSDDGGSRDYAKDGENALIVGPNDTAALRSQITKALDDAALRSHLIENGLRTAFAHGWDALSADFAEFLSALKR